MAIKKTVTKPNGIVTEYHRIAMVKIDINEQNTLLVYSYLSEAGRQIEKDYAAGLYADVGEGMMNWPYVDAQYLNCDYDGEMTIVKAYDYLKTLPEFEGAIDV
jgi:hypothetical protein